MIPYRHRTARKVKNKNLIVRVRPSITPGWIHGDDHSRKISLIEPQGKSEIITR